MININNILTNLERDITFFYYYRKEWKNKFENKMLFYKIIQKECRSISGLENYNKYIIMNLKCKQFLEWINL